MNSIKNLSSHPIFLPGSQPFRQCHASTIVETLDGRLLSAWFGGTYEGHPDVAIWLAEFSDGRWSPPLKVADAPGVPLWNPVLFRDAGGVIWLFYKVGPDVPSWTGAHIRSADQGRTWSPPTYLPAGLHGPAKNKPIALSNGEILCGASAESWRSWACWAEISADGGTSWQRHGPIRVPPGEEEPLSAGGEQVSGTWNPAAGKMVLPESFAGVIQPAVWEYAPGHLKMLMRSTRRVGSICAALSADYGRTWTPTQPTVLPNPNSGIDAARLADGRVALVYNPSQEERTPLALALSEDNGETWPKQLTLAGGPGEFSYPAVIQAADGRVHVTYTWKRETIQHVVVEV